MRSYTYIIIALLSLPVLAQDATITISYGQTKEQAVSIFLSPSAQTITHDTQASQFVQNMAVDVTLPCCASGWAANWLCNMGYETAWNCGTINLCAKYDQDTALDCKILQNKKTQTATFEPKKVIQKVTFTYTGSRNVPVKFPATEQTTVQVTITKIKLIGGGYAQIVRPLQSLRGETHIFLGLVRERINVQTYTGSVAISTDNPQAVAWFNEASGYSATNRVTTSDFNDEILACLDSDTNKLCDFEDERLCAGQGKDWFKGHCCHDAPFNPESETPPSECTWYSTKNNIAMNAVCGKNAQNEWNWAALEDIGLISILSGSCPSMQLVSDGTTFHTCSTGTQTTIPSSLVTQLTGKITIIGHEYFCQGETIIECGGDAPYSPTAKQTGDSATHNDKKHYCTQDGKWATSLDAAGRDNCVAAGLKWTGTKCCGETDDPLKTYEDAYTGTGTAGACYNNQFIASGSYYAGEKGVINYRGKFIICDPTRQPGTSAPTTSPLFAGTGITPVSHGPCGTPLQQAILTGTLQHIICTPAGEWQFTGKTEEHLAKQTLWQPSETEQKKGCCTDNQCWDGKQCRDIGYYYDKIAGKGYRCE